MSSAANHDPPSGRAQLGLDSSQVVNFLRNIPGLLKEASQGEGDAAQILSNLAQSQSFGGPHTTGHHIGSHQMPQHPYPSSHHQLSDPGPSSHPRGPPNLGQAISSGSLRTPPMSSARTPVSDESPGDAEGQSNDIHGSPTNSNSGSGRTRSGRGANMSNDEWARQRKDNHKEVERRRRGNINEGINELGRIVPNGSGEKAKGAILSRAVQYIHHLKENEARNIEKWTLEKLLMDQAMGDLQTQLEEMRRLWEEERDIRQRIEGELDALRGGGVGVTRRTEKSPVEEEAHSEGHDDESDLRAGKRKRGD